ncbi:MAG: methylenetetrahydrofolate reductase [NAD(P)H] [Spirochaetia bacterium]|nr:methylenetetrahydrofolate reductase [NAD(P)H] [Spirochaetia bacterium]
MKKISDIYQKASSNRSVFSFEFFPPKNENGEKNLYETIENLKYLNPDFVSVTYGAGGTTQEKTKEWVETIQNKFSMPAMAHFTCVGASRSEILENLRILSESGIKNIMALRGDPPQGQEVFQKTEDGFSHASELIAFIRENKLDFSLGGACYPEKHPEAKNLEKDIENLKKKVDAGVDFLVTQLFFDNNAYFDFIDKCAKKNIKIPIVPGIMPITMLKQIERFTAMAGCRIPDELVKSLQECGDNKEKLLRTSIEYSANQCRELLDAGAPGIHFYTLNQSKATAEILKLIQEQ